MPETDPWRLGWYPNRVGRMRSLPGLTSPRLFLLSFATLILVGTAGLLVLPGLYAGPRLSLLDALFTATSAVCVTGLIVVDTATFFSPLGQAWIALLIQLGGLGILTFTTLLALGLGRRAGIRLEEASGVPGHHLAELSRGKLIRAIVLTTVSLEGLGALGLWVSWRGEMGNAGALFPALFHSVSAFCNAGFSTFSDSLIGYRESPATLGIVMALVVLGGLGFLVLEELRRRTLARTLRRLSLHSRVVLVATALLLATSWVMFTWFEWGHQLAGLSPFHRLLNGAFMAVTPRTAGFNTVDYGAVSDPSLFLSLLLMLTGGSPGSTAGGLKTVTLALLVAVLAARVRGRSRVTIFNRSIPKDTVQRAMGLAVGGVFILAGAVFLLLLTELPSGAAGNRGEFLALVFETGSAFGTVGLSMGVTASLSGLGRLLITLLMFTGRVGLLVLVGAMVVPGRGASPPYRFGEEDVTIG